MLVTGERGCLVNTHNAEIVHKCYRVLVYYLPGSVAVSVVQVKENKIDVGYPVMFLLCCLERTQHLISRITQHHLVDATRSNN